MTAALCLACGSIKFGAFLPCTGCSGPPTGDKNLDCLFSDHFFTKSSLERLGEVVNRLNKQGADRNITTWSFLYLYSGWYPEGFGITLPAPVREQCAAVLQGLDIIGVRLEKTNGQVVEPRQFSPDPIGSPDAGVSESPDEAQVRAAVTQCQQLAKERPLPRTRRGEPIDEELYGEHARAVGQVCTALAASVASLHKESAFGLALQVLNSLIERANGARPASQAVLTKLLKAHSALAGYDPWHHDKHKDMLITAAGLLAQL